MVVEEQEFAESKAAAGERGAGFQPQQNSNPFQSAPAPSAAAGDGFMNIPDGIDEELPFNWQSWNSFWNIEGGNSHGLHKIR